MPLIGSSVDWNNTAEEKTGKNEDMSIQTSQTKIQRERKKIQEFVGRLQKV